MLLLYFLLKPCTNQTFVKRYHSRLQSHSLLRQISEIYVPSKKIFPTQDQKVMTTPSFPIASKLGTCDLLVV